MNEPVTDDQPIVGGVDTHKEQHVVAVVDAHDRVLASAFFPATRHGYKAMVRWMRTFGRLQRIGVESTGSYGAGLLRYLQHAGLDVLEVTTPDQTDRRKRGKNDTIDAENADYDVMIKALVDELAPALIARQAVGYSSGAQLLITAGDNPERLRSEASFAALCGVSPIPASSGKTHRHCLNRGGDRAANSALHIIAIGRLRLDERTRAYVDKRIGEGHSKLEAIRCLKRYLAREVFRLLRDCNQAINLFWSSKNGQ